MQDKTAVSTSMLMGATMGTVEGVFTHPFWTLKTRHQGNLPLTGNLFTLYRGLTIRIVSNIPLDVIQATASRVCFERLLPDDWENSPKRYVAGFIGGTISALVSGPSELMMAKKQFDGRPEVSQASLLKKIAHSFKGFLATASRDGIFCSSIFGGVPILTKTYQKEGLSEFQAGLKAGIICGIAAAILSQPMDTIKTDMQLNEGFISLRKAFYHRFQQKGIEGLFAGLGWRIVSVPISVLILGNLTVFFENKLDLKK